MFPPRPVPCELGEVFYAFQQIKYAEMDSLCALKNEREVHNLNEKMAIYERSRGEK